MRIIKCPSQTLPEIQSEKKKKPIYNYYGLKDENYLFYVTSRINLQNKFPVRKPAMSCSLEYHSQQKNTHFSR